MSISKITDTSQNNDQLYSSLSQNLKIIKNTLGNSNDLVIREITIGKAEQFTLAIIYVDGLTDKLTISNAVIDKLMLDIEDNHNEEIGKIIRYLRDSCLTVGDVNDIFHFSALYNSILNGNTVILLDESSTGIVTSTQGAKDRAVMEPSTESVIRGPRESFTETLRTNTALIRRKIKSPNLWIKSRIIGEVTKRKLLLCI